MLKKNKFYFYPAKQETVDIFNKYGIYIDWMNYKEHNFEQVKKCDFLWIWPTIESIWNGKIISHIVSVWKINDYALDKLSNIYNNPQARFSPQIIANLKWAIDEHYNVYEKNNVGFKDFLDYEFTIIICDQNCFLTEKDINSLIINKNIFNLQQLPAYEIREYSLFHWFRWVMEIPASIEYLWDELKTYLNSQFGLDKYKSFQEEVFLPNSDHDTRIQWWTTHLENFLIYIKDLVRHVENQYGGKMKDFFYVLWQISSVPHTWIAWTTILWFDDFIRGYAWNHTIFYWCIILDNDIIIKLNPDWVTYFSNFIVYKK